MQQIYGIVDFRQRDVAAASDMAAAVFIAAASAGYSLHAAHELAQQRQFRESLRDKALNNTMTDEEKQAWRESRIKTRDIIKKDLMEKKY